MSTILPQVSPSSVYLTDWQFNMRQWSSGFYLRSGRMHSLCHACSLSRLQNCVVSFFGPLWTFSVWILAFWPSGFPCRIATQPYRAISGGVHVLGLLLSSRSCLLTRVVLASGGIATFSSHLRRLCERPRALHQRADSRSWFVVCLLRYVQQDLSVDLRYFET